MWRLCALITLWDRKKHLFTFKDKTQILYHIKYETLCIRSERNYHVIEQKYVDFKLWQILKKIRWKKRNDSNFYCTFLSTVWVYSTHVPSKCPWNFLSFYIINFLFSSFKWYKMKKWPTMCLKKFERSITFRLFSILKLSNLKTFVRNFSGWE